MASKYPDVVPTTNQQLQTHYGRFIGGLISNHNKVERNFEDLHQDIWSRLLQAGVLARYWELVDITLPKTMLRDEACHFLGVTQTQWRNAMVCRHTGIVVNGERKLGRQWMPTPINMLEFEAQGKKGYFSAEALFDTQDIVKLADEYADANGYAMSVFPNRGELNWPASKASPAHFRNYLAQAVRNHYNNWCRTQARRNKETPGSALVGEEGVQWDQNLQTMQTQPSRWSKEEREDHKARKKAGKLPRQYMAVRDSPAVVTANSEILVALAEAKEKIKTTLYQGMEGVDSCKPIEDHEAEMFQGLADGRTLEQVVKRMQIPKQVKRAVLRSVLPPGP